MSPTNFTMSYEALSNAANALDDAAQKYQQMISQLQVAADRLGLVGVAGHYARLNIEKEQGNLRGMINRAHALRGALQATLQDMQGDVDPGMAARFNE
jgi:uncharacterized protein YukE